MYITAIKFSIENCLLVAYTYTHTTDTHTTVGGGVITGVETRGKTE